MSATLLMDHDDPKKTRKAIIASSIVLIIICKVDFLSDSIVIMSMEFAVKKGQLATAGSLVVFYFLTVFYFRAVLIGIDKLANYFLGKVVEDKKLFETEMDIIESGRDLPDRDYVPDSEDRARIEFSKRTDSLLRTNHRIGYYGNLIIDYFIPILLGFFALRLAKRLVSYSDFFNIT